MIFAIVVLTMTLQLHSSRSTPGISSVKQRRVIANAKLQRQLSKEPILLNPPIRKSPTLLQSPIINKKSEQVLIQESNCEFIFMDSIQVVSMKLSVANHDFKLCLSLKLKRFDSFSIERLQELFLLSLNNNVDVSLLIIDIFGRDLDFERVEIVKIVLQKIQHYRTLWLEHDTALYLKTLVSYKTLLIELLNEDTVKLLNAIPNFNLASILDKSDPLYLYLTRYTLIKGSLMSIKDFSKLICTIEDNSQFQLEIVEQLSNKSPIELGRIAKHSFSTPNCHLSGLELFLQSSLKNRIKLSITTPNQYIKNSKYIKKWSPWCRSILDAKVFYVLKNNKPTPISPRLDIAIDFLENNKEIHPSKYKLTWKCALLHSNPIEIIQYLKLKGFSLENPIVSEN